MMNYLIDRKKFCLWAQANSHSNRGGCCFFSRNIKFFAKITIQFGRLAELLEQDQIARADEGRQAEQPAASWRQTNSNHPN